MRPHRCVSDCMLLKCWQILRGYAAFTIAAMLLCCLSDSAVCPTRHVLGDTTNRALRQTSFLSMGAYGQCLALLFLKAARLLHRTRLLPKI